MIRFGSRAARPLRGRPTSGLWNPIETRESVVDLCGESRIHHTRTNWRLPLAIHAGASHTCRLKGCHRMSGLAYTSGHSIGGRYCLVAKLGAGGMGEVWQAEHVTLKSQVAIKFINPELAASGNGLQRFLREAQACAALKSSHIVQVFDFGVDHEVPYIAMELLKGENLGERLQREHALTPAATGMILTHVARAMTHAHEVGIVHRDLKPDNVFIVREHGAEIAKVVDFGVAKVTGGGLDSTTGGGTKTGAILGTPFYVSPEQARGNKAVDFRSDLWALGVIVYECLT